MSREFPCVYYENQMCKKYTDENINSWCVLGPCADRIETNADRIRAMSDEELAGLLLNACVGSKCGEQPLNEYGSVDCFACRMKWLKQPAEEVDKDA